MDLGKRLDQLDEEQKLLKNEIKQVLLEIQEQVLTVQNPFTNMAASLAADRHVESKQNEVLAKASASSDSGRLRTQVARLPGSCSCSCSGP